MTQAIAGLTCALLMLNSLHLHTLARASPASEQIERTERPALGQRSTQPTPTTDPTKPAGQFEIRGLYNELAEYITPIQGKADFRRRVLGLSADIGTLDECPTTHEHIQEAGRNQTLSMVQFYLATCPDCQGFSPYFKRLARDIGPHWQKLLRIFVVNCNDHQNIHLCQEENIRLVVPTVRWYVLPVLQADARYRAAHEPNSTSVAGGALCPSLDYPRALLSVTNRQFVERQRRDLISLRRATLRLIALMLDELSNDSHRVALKHALSDQYRSASEPSRELFDALPVHWHLLAQLGRDQPEELSAASQLFGDLAARISACHANGSGRATPATADNLNRSKKPRASTDEQQAPPPLTVFLVFESRRSFVGRTVIADWSQYVCDAEATKKATTSDQDGPGKLMMVLRSSELSLLSVFNATLNLSTSATVEHDMEPTLISFELGPAGEDAANKTKSADWALRDRLRNVRVLSGPARSAADRAAEIISTETGHTARALHPGRGHRVRRREQVANKTAKNETSQADRDNANWVPEVVYPREEQLRYQLNLEIARAMNLTMRRDLNDTQAGPLLPGSLLAGRNPGEFSDKPNNQSLQVVDPRTDDLSLMFLTDYYKGLDEILHLDLLSKGDLDGYQLLAACCFLRDLKRHFPFQGDAHGSHRVGKSVARHYVRLVQAAWLRELKKHLLSRDGTGLPRPAHDSLAAAAAANGTTDGKLGQLLERLQWPASDEDVECPKVEQLAEELERANEVATHRSSRASGPNATLAAQMEGLRVPSRHLEQVQTQIKRQHNVGLPSEKRFRWYYCAGSGAYLRGHTCSLWVLFHTLTVSEYLRALGPAAAAADETADSQAPLSPPSEYRWQIDYSRRPSQPCDPKEPERAYLGSKTSELHANETQYVLANIINFVRYFLPCPHCAAHFSCMVSHSPGLSLQSEAGAANSAPDDSHILWLWEGHNRVNERTRGTHSEDPARPKHVFPCYEACPQCYLERPASNSTALDERKFNRHELVKFIVARYRRTSILNNRVNIEILYKDSRRRRR